MDAVGTRAAIRWLIFGPVCGLLGVAIGWWLADQLRPMRDSVFDALPDVATQDDSARLPLVEVPLPSLAPLVEAVRGGVVGIRTDHLAEADGITGGTSHGSGFVIDEEGLVLTALHVVARARTVVVRVPEFGDFEADLVGAEPTTDLAVVRLRAPPPGLQVLQLDQVGQHRQGDWVVTIGSPLSLQQTVSFGIVSFVGRHLRETEDPITNEYLQFSAPVNPGQSGSPVFDLRGRVIGMTTRSARSFQGLSFALTARTIRRVLLRMDEGQGVVARSHIGVTLEELERSIVAPHVPDGGVAIRIKDVTPGLPADDAGLRVGDSILSVDGQPIPSMNDLHDWIIWSRPGTKMVFEVARPESTDIELVTVQLAELGDTPRRGEE